MKWIKWYPIDWLHSTCIQELDPAERTAWLGFVCLASIREPYGSFRFTTEESLSQFLRIPENILKSTLEKCEVSKRLRVKNNGYERVVTICKFKRYQPQLNVYKKVKDISDLYDKTHSALLYSTPIYLDLNSWSWKNIKEEDRSSWGTAYPACDIEQELLKMVEWIKANPSQKKSNWRRFIVNWLTRAQDRGGTVRRNQPDGNPPGTWLKMMKEKEARGEKI